MGSEQPVNNQTALGPIMLDLEGLELQADEEALLQHPLVGGVIFFARNFESVDQLMALVKSIRNIRPNLVLAVDQEGGRVQRFKSGYTRIPAMQSFYTHYQQIGDREVVLSLLNDVGWLLAAEVIASGVDMSFAPVLDVDDAHCSVIADRSFSADPHIVTEFAKAFINGMHEAGMAVTGKHFPGHGSVTEDSHLALPIDERSFKDIESSDLIPFVKLMDQLDAVMPAHIIFSNIDQSPVGFSRHWLQNCLRDTLRFNGVIFSDDLSMEGAASAGSYGDRAEQALNAGCDVVLVCNDRKGALKVVERLDSLAFSPTNKLSNMSAKRKWDWNELKNDPRWLTTRKRLDEAFK